MKNEEMRVLQDETVFVLLNNANERQISHFSFLISHFSLYLCTAFEKQGRLAQLV